MFREAIRMDPYITGPMIKNLREEKHLTQAELAEKLYVSEKAVSKWETGRGYPDISIIEDLANALGVSTIELMTGEQKRNVNRSANMKRVKFYVCPICGNVITAAGDAVISCCGVTLPALEAEIPDESHSAVITTVEDDYFFELPHEMSRTHYISFAASVTDDKVEIKKFYPEGNAECRFQKRYTECIYFYCNRHGLFKQTVR